MMASRRAFNSSKPITDGLKEGELIFTLTTPDRDTYKTRFNPMGARFRPAKPWLDSHNDESCATVIGKMEPVYQGPDALRVKVIFDMEKPEGAEIYRQHTAGFIEGCSQRFDPIEYHVEAEGDAACDKCSGACFIDGSACVACFGTGKADTTLVYDVYDILEGSSCAVPSNPNALMVRAAGVAEDRALAAIRAAKSTTIQTLIFSKEKFSKAEAVKWAKDHDYKTGVDETTDSYRLRQRDPDEMTGMKTISLTDGVQAIIGHLKEKRVAMPDKPITDKPIETKQPETSTTVRNVPMEQFTKLEGSGDIGSYHPVHMSLKPEHRHAMRYAVGDHMRMAHDHMDMHRMSDHPDHKRFHREHALGHMRGALHMTRMIADDMAEGHEDAPQDAALVTGMMRACPVEGDVELANEWANCQRSALAYAERTFAGVCQDQGCKSPEDVMVRFAAAKTTADAYKRILTQEKRAAKQTEDVERLEIVKAMRSSEAGLEPGLEAQMLGLDPVGYDPAKKDNTRKGAAWSLDAIRQYRTQVEGAVTPIVRQAPLRNAAPTDAKPVNPAESVIPAPAEHKGNGISAPLEAKLREAARSTGIDFEKLMATTRKVAQMQEKANA